MASWNKDYRDSNPDPGWYQNVSSHWPVLGPGEPGIDKLIDIICFQGWSHLFACPLPMVYESEMVEFYMNLEVLDEETIIIFVLEVLIVFDIVGLEQLLHVHIKGYAEYNLEKIDDCTLTSKYT
ncbi:hypothetical protein HAX54_001514 [Datura stramonium]|uniref:Uncharacterized protein n=1 Tax=Datura stramonium TaxID=4076 RepID=A0ABS8RSS2_DATST|nr:hypothetical protein [Datura stramonium]